MKYIPIDSVLFDVTSLIQEKEFNHKKFKEWAVLGFKKFPTYQKYREMFYISVVSDHKVPLPENFIHPLQIAYVNTTDINNTSLLEELKIVMNFDSSKHNSSLQYITDPESLPKKAASLIQTYSWKPLRLGSSTFSKIVDVPEGALYSAYNSSCLECEHTYSIDHDCITTSFKDGYILIAYLGYHLDKDGNILIPDLPELKEAIVHFILYRYWLAKANLKEQGAMQMAQMNLSRYALLKAKASAELSAPTIDQLENILNRTNRLIQRTNHYSNFFSTLNSRVNE